MKRASLFALLGVLCALGCSAGGDNPFSDARVRDGGGAEGGDAGPMDTGTITRDVVRFDVVEDAPIVKYVNLLITQAIQDRASDIHLEPNEHSLVVRYRIDGVLHEVMKSPKNFSSRGMSRRRHTPRACHRDVTRMLRAARVYARAG